MNDSDRAGESESYGSSRDGYRVFRVADTAADHRVDVYGKLGMLGKKLQLLVEHLKAFHRDVIRLDVVDADLKMFEPGVIQGTDFLRGQQVAVCNHPGDHAVLPYAADDGFDFRVKQRFPSA